MSRFRHIVPVLAWGISCVTVVADETAKTDPQEAFERKVLYHPRAYDPADIDAFKTAGGVRLDYKTDQGKQTAWLIVPADNTKADHLWVVCGGNGTLALELAPLVRDLGFKTDAFLLIDYPGYGKCEGSPSPTSVRQNVKTSVDAAAKQLGIDPAKTPEKILVLGHSLGCSACLMAVEEFHLKSAVLCAPFTSTHEMAELRFGLDKNAPMVHQFDNRPGLKELKKNGGRAWIFHGSDDEIIPVDMSKTLAAEFDGVAKLSVVDKAGHNDLLDAAKKQIIDAMTEAEK